LVGREPRRRIAQAVEHLLDVGLDARGEALFEDVWVDPGRSPDLAVIGIDPHDLLRYLPAHLTALMVKDAKEALPVGEAAQVHLRHVVMGLGD